MSQPPQRQMSQRPGRRLPPARRLDYILIPAPLDLSLHTITEKSPYPAIIVTPSSPTHSKDFAIAFLSTPKPPSFFSRCAATFKEKVKGKLGKVREAMPVQVGFGGRFWGQRWGGGRGEYAPIALPISAPPTQTEFSIPTYPGEKRGVRMSKVGMVITAVFVLVFCHMIAHLFTRATLPGMGLGPTSPLVNVDVGVDGVVSGGAKEKAYAYLGRLEMKQWLGWVVAGKKRTEGVSV